MSPGTGKWPLTSGQLHVSKHPSEVIEPRAFTPNLDWQWQKSHQIIHNSFTENEQHSVKLQWGVTPAGPPSYSAAWIILDLTHRQNTRVTSKMAEFVLPEVTPGHVNSAGWGHSNLQNSQTRDDPLTLFPILFGVHSVRWINGPKFWFITDNFEICLPWWVWGNSWHKLTHTE